MDTLTLLAIIWLVLTGAAFAASHYAPEPYKRYARWLAAGLTLGGLTFLIGRLTSSGTADSSPDPKPPPEAKPVVILEGPSEKEVEVANNLAEDTSEALETIDAHDERVPDESADPDIGAFIRANSSGDEP